MPRLLTLLILLVALAAGCGDDGSDDSPAGGSTDAGERATTGEDRAGEETTPEEEPGDVPGAEAEAEVREAAESFLDAVANGDSQGICDLLARAAREVTERQGECATVIERATTQRARANARESTITAIDVTGTRATVRHNTPGGPGALALTRESGEWRVLGDE